jgi:hypothetical protein
MAVAGAMVVTALLGVIAWRAADGLGTRAAVPGTATPAPLPAAPAEGLLIEATAVPDGPRARYVLGDKGRANVEQWLRSTKGSPFISVATATQPAVRLADVDVWNVWVHREVTLQLWDGRAGRVMGEPLLVERLPVVAGAVARLASWEYDLQPLLSSQRNLPPGTHLTVSIDYRRYYQTPFGPGMHLLQGSMTQVDLQQFGARYPALFASAVAAR